MLRSYKVGYIIIWQRCYNLCTFDPSIGGPKCANVVHQEETMSFSKTLGLILCQKHSITLA